MGLGILGTPTDARLVSLTTNSGGFEAELELTNGANGTTEVYVNSTGETVAIVEVPWPAAGITGSAGSFSIGIENDPLTGGSRLVEWTGASAIITNRSGATRNITNDKVCVAGRYGVAAGPAGYFKYQAVTPYNRTGRLGYSPVHAPELGRPALCRLVPRPERLPDRLKCHSSCVGRFWHKRSAELFRYQAAARLRFRCHCSSQPCRCIRRMCCRSRM